MLELHIHTNEPQRFFHILKPYSKEEIFKEEKVEDMKIMRDVEHGSSTSSATNPSDAKANVDNAKFTIIGLSSLFLPPTVKAKNDKILNTFPIFVVPSDTNEPMVCRYVSDAETVLTLNKQRNPATVVRLTTATSIPIQMKIELLAALSKGKPVLCIVFTNIIKISAFGRNVLQAIDILEIRPERHGQGVCP